MIDNIKPGTYPYRSEKKPGGGCPFKIRLGRTKATPGCFLFLYYGNCVGDHK